jgi:hypothetical protein
MAMPTEDQRREKANRGYWEKRLWSGSQKFDEHALAEVLSEIWTELNKLSRDKK